MTLVDHFEGHLLKALGHPLRHQIVSELTEQGEASPSGLARQLDLPLSTVSHHIRMLRELGWVELVRTEPRRGAVEHFYKAVTPAFMDDDRWESLSLAMRRGLAGQTFRQIFTEALRAGTDGGFDHSGAHIDRVPLQLDQRGRRELSDALTSLLREAEEIQRRVEVRGASSEGRAGTVTSTRLAILYFTLPASDATSPNSTQAPPAARPQPKRRPRLP